MASVTKWFFIIAGMSILLFLAGIPTGFGLIVRNTFQNPELFTNSFFYLTVLGVLTAIGLGTLTVGLVSNFSPESYLLIGYCTVLLSFVADIIIVYSYVLANYAGWVANIVGLIMVPMAIAYVSSIISWWGNRP